MSHHSSASAVDAISRALRDASTSKRTRRWLLERTALGAIGIAAAGAVVRAGEARTDVHQEPNPPDACSGNLSPARALRTTSDSRSSNFQLSAISAQPPKRPGSALGRREQPLDASTTSPSLRQRRPWRSRGIPRHKTAGTFTAPYKERVIERNTFRRSRRKERAPIPLPPGESHWPGLRRNLTNVSEKRHDRHTAEYSHPPLQ